MKGLIPLEHGTSGRRIAVVGSGIAGLGAARRLEHQGHRVTLFEANAQAGGHSNTVDVRLDGRVAPVDTGFLVFNDRTYPELLKLFADLGVQSAPSEMSFSLRNDEDGIEWAGTNFASLFAQRRNALRPAFWRMLSQIARFNRAALDAVASGPSTNADESLGGYLARNGYGREFREWYLIPMAAAIWSSPRADIEDFPLRSFARFCANHGLLQLRDRPQWRTVIGGSRDYVRRIVSGLSDVRVDCPVTGIRRQHGTVRIRYSDHGCATSEKFDQVVLACHADQALRLLDDPSAGERALLGAIRFQPNRAVLHSDASLMPRSRRAWSAWNYLSAIDPEHSRPVAVTYWINRLQPLPFSTDVLVTLNPPFEPAPDRVIAEFEFDHPLHDSKAVAAQRAFPAIQGERRTWYCGAWLGYGFHEDGLRSGHAVADAIAGLPVSRGPQVPIRLSDKAGAGSHIGATIPVAAAA